MLRKLLSTIILTIPLLLSVFTSPPTVSAATFRSGDTVSVSQTLEDLYASGGTITITAPIRNDLTVAGGTINVDNSISGGLIAAGGTINVKGQVGNTIRAAGGTITISRPVRRDVVVFGGTINLDEAASISGDLVVSGGQVSVQGPVTGDVRVNGGEVTINAPVGGNVEGNVGELILGNKAVINGNLNYSAEKRATLRDGAVLKGQENFKQTEKHDDNGKQFAGLLTGFSLYKLITDILAGLALIYLFYNFTRRVTLRGGEEPLKNGLLGLVTLILGPIIGIMLLVLLLPGIVTLLLYVLILILAAFLSKILIGWLLLRWWYGRNNTDYVLDWKAAVLGPIVMFLLLLIPVIGWFIGFLLYLVAIGSVTSEFFSWISSPRERATTPARVRTAEVRPARTSRSVRATSTRTSRTASRSSTRKRR